MFEFLLANPALLVVIISVGIVVGVIAVNLTRRRNKNIQYKLALYEKMVCEVRIDLEELIHHCKATNMDLPKTKAEVVKWTTTVPFLMHCNRSDIFPDGDIDAWVKYVYKKV